MPTKSREVLTLDLLFYLLLSYLYFTNLFYLPTSPTLPILPTLPITLPTLPVTLSNLPTTLLTLLTYLTLLNVVSFYSNLDR